VEQLGGPPTAAIGWALGMERLVLLLAQAAVEPTVERPQLYVVSRGERAEVQALVLARQLRQAGRAVELDLSGAAFGKQLRRADRSGAEWAVLIGDSEVEQQELILKALRPGDGTEERLPLQDLLRRFA